MTHSSAPKPTLTFDRLPPDWPTRSLAEPLIASGVVDLTVPVRDRHGWSVTVLLCDGYGRLVQPCLVAEVPRASNDLDKLRLLKPFAAHARECGGGLLVARARPGPTRVDPEDISWARAARNACRVRSVPLLGFYVATPSHVIPLDSRDLSAA